MRRLIKSIVLDKRPWYMNYLASFLRSYPLFYGEKEEETISRVNGKDVPALHIRGNLGHQARHADVVLFGNFN